MRRLIPAAFVMTFAVGCASYRTPEGDDAATLRGAVKTAMINSVDREPTWSWYNPEGVAEVKLSPGKHTVRVCALLGGWYAEGELWLVAAPHGEYELHYYCREMRVAFWIVDKATGLAVGGVKGSDDEPRGPVDSPNKDQHDPTSREQKV